MVPAMRRPPRRLCDEHRHTNSKTTSPREAYLLALLAAASLASCSKKDEATPAPSLVGTWTSVSEQQIIVDANGFRTETTSSFTPQQFTQEFSATTLKNYQNGTLSFERPYHVSGDTLYVGNPVAIRAFIRLLTATRLELVSTRRTDATTTITSISVR